MAIQYEIENGVLILRVATHGFDSLRGALHAATESPAAPSRMPLLVDARGEVSGVRYEDALWRAQILALMRQQLGPRWAILTGTGPVRVGVGRMFTVFSRVEGLEVGMFADKAAALKWLRAPIAPDTPGTI